MSRPTHAQIALMIFLLALLSVFLLYPIWLTVRGGFEGVGGGFTLHHVSVVFTDPALRMGLVRSLAIAVFTTTLSLLIAVPLAVVMAKYEFPGKGLAGPLLLIPLILPPFVGAIGLHQLLGRSGVLNTAMIDLGLIDQGFDFIGRGGLWAIVIIEALHLYPIAYLNVVAALANIDPALEQAAENLGASPWRRFRTVTLPLIRPGLFAGSTIVFIWSFTELGTPLMFDYQQVTPVQIYNGLKEMAVSKQPFALTAVMLGIAALAYVLGRLVLAGRTEARVTKAALAAESKSLPRGRGLLVTAMVSLVIVLAVLPHIGVIMTSFSETGRWYRSILPQAWTMDHYAEALRHPLAVGSIRNSLLFASGAVIADMVLGIMIGYLIVRTVVPGRRILDTLSMIPLAVPGLVMAFGYVAMSLRWPFGPDDPLEGWVDVIGPQPNPVPLLIIAYAVRRLPYVVRATVAGLEQTSRELEEAACNLGASAARMLRTVTVPLIAANLIAGGLLAFSFAVLEVSDSLILAQRAEHYPITKAIYVLYARLGDGPHIASALGVWGMALLGLTLLGASMIMGKRLGALVRV